MTANYPIKLHQISIWIYQFWPALVSSLVVGIAGTMFCRRLALILKITDNPDNLVKTHKKPVPYLGGIGILAGMAAGILVGLYCVGDEPYAPSLQKSLFFILAISVFIAIVGLIDDIYELKPEQKMMGQFIAATGLIFAGIRPDLTQITKQIGMTMPEWMDLAIAASLVFLIVVGTINSLNLLDGLDGLCGGVTAISTLAMLLLAVLFAVGNGNQVDDLTRIILCLGLLGGVGGFLIFNWTPAKIFMGDTGSMLLGFLIATLILFFSKELPKWWMASIVIAGLPILDTSTTLMRRWINKRPLFESDRGHLYDQMMDAGLNVKTTVLVCYGLTAIFALVGLGFTLIPTFYAAIAYVVFFAISALVIWRLGYLKMDGIRGPSWKKNHRIVKVS